MTNEMPQDAEPLATAPAAAGGISAWVESQVRNTPWWLISIAFHLIVLAGMTVVTFKDEIKTVTEPSIVPIVSRAARLEFPDRPNDVFTNKGHSTADMVRSMAEVNDDPILPTYLDAEDGDHNESDDDMLTHTMKGESKDFFGTNPGNTKGIGRGVGGPGSTDVVGVGDGGGSGGRYGDPFGGGSRKVRKIGPSGSGTGTKSSEDAVRWGLWWLARHQNANGSWSSEAYPTLCSGSKCDGGGYNDYDAGVTGLALLAYLGAGYTHLTRETYIDPITKKTMCYGDVVKAGVKWLMVNQDAEGCFGGRRGSKFMYNHAISALAMAEAYGLTNSALFKTSAQAGIDFLCQAQQPYKAWAYAKQDTANDTSVTGWVVMALKSAGMAKLEVGRTAYEGAKAWIQEVTDEAYYRTGYRAKADGHVVVKGKNDDYDDHPALTAVGMLVRIFVDHNEKDPALEGGKTLLMGDLPGYGGKKTDYYYWYYGSLALFQYDGAEGKAFKAWNDSMQKAIIPSQHPLRDGCKYGSWDAEGVDRWGFEGGRVYSTAMNVLTLEVYYRYASALGRK